MKDIAPVGDDVRRHAAGSRDVLAPAHFERMRDGVILAEAGGVDVGIDVDGLRESSSETREVRRNVEEFVVGGKTPHPVGRGWS